jgi:hypothetical protein
MIEGLGYPKSLIAVEQPIDSLPHSNIKTNRRADIICFSKNSSEELYPLLLIECKAVPISEDVFRQVEGYNTVVKAFFFTVVNQTEIFTCWLNEQKERKTINYLPTYQQLIKAAYG